MPEACLSLCGKQGSGELVRGVLELDEHAPLGRYDTVRCEMQLARRVVEHIIAILAAFEERTIPVHALRSRDHQNELLALGTSESIRPLHAFIDIDHLRAELPSGDRTGGVDGCRCEKPSTRHEAARHGCTLQLPCQVGERRAAHRVIDVSQASRADG